MATHLRLVSPAPAAKTYQINHKSTPLFSSSNPNITPSRKSYHRIQSSNFGSFLDLINPVSKPHLLDFDHLSWFDPADHRSSCFDVIIIGTGPAGLGLAEQVSHNGIEVCCVDPSPLSIWSNNYGVWVDEFESLGLVACLDKTWPMTCLYMDDHKTRYLDRPYGLVDRKGLKTKLLEKCVSNGVRFCKAKVWKVEHEEFESSIVCEDGTELKASLVVDASGHASTFIEYGKPRNHGYQIAQGILAEVDGHPFELDKIVMDWRDSHLGNEPYLRASNSRIPTFLYVMPFNGHFPI